MTYNFTGKVIVIYETGGSNRNALRDNYSDDNFFLNFSNFYSQNLSPSFVLCILVLHLLFLELVVY